MRVDVEDVFANANERGTFNGPDLKDIEFYRDGKRIIIPDDIIGEWKFIGLSNTAFILDYEWPDG